MSKQSECKRCGTCCQKGGPALHKEDIVLLRSGVIPLDNLVTVRKNEPAYRPDLDKIMPAENEFIKLGGKGKSWECFFYDSASSSCLIHAKRPVECRLLQCWDTRRIKAVIGKNYLTRLDVIPEDNPIISCISRHETLCPYDKVNQLVALRQSGANNSDIKSKLATIVHADLGLRDDAVRKCNLTLGMELFYFGRPLFQVINFDVS
jgi:Fe-S-cluster containining protein